MSEHPQSDQDTGDLVGLDENDVTPNEVTPDHPDYVEPYAGATRPYVKEV